MDKEEEATHILHPVAEANDESYARAVFKRGEKCLVHFYRSVRTKELQSDKLSCTVLCALGHHRQNVGPWRLGCKKLEVGSNTVYCTPLYISL